MLPIILDTPIVIDEDTYKQSREEINKIDNNTKAIDTYWIYNISINGEIILPYTAVFWLFFWADTKGKDIARQVFRNIFNISYEDFYNALELIKPGFKTDGRKNNKDRNNLKSSKRISEETIVGIIEKLYGIRISEKIIKEELNSILEEQDAIMSRISVLTNYDIDKEINKLQNKKRNVGIRSYSTKQRDQYLMELYKKKRHYKCQFCNKKILKANGNFYIEACHIISVEDGGNDNENNILILCPNCHKEFDYGKREEIKLNEEKYIVILNGVKHEIIF